jgi:hypothetical protein
MNKYYTNEALVSFKKSLSFDSTFAMTYYQMAVIPSVRLIVGVPTHMEWLAKAELYSDNVNWKDQRFIKAAVAAWRGNITGALAEYDQIIERSIDSSQAERNVQAPLPQSWQQCQP